MKKIVFLFVSLALAVSSAACTSSSTTTYETIYTSSAPEADTVSEDDYEDSLDGLVEYLMALGYIPESSEATEMLSSVIGAEVGVRYVYYVNSSSVVLELYEYDTDNLNEEAVRILNEVKADGEFALFETSDSDEDQIFEAVLSNSEKYLMIYTDSSTNEDNVTRVEDIQNALKTFKD